MPNTTGGGPVTDADIRGEKRDDDLWGDIVKPALGCLDDLKLAHDLLAARLPDFEFDALLRDTIEEIVYAVCDKLEERGMSWRMIDKSRSAMRESAGLPRLGLGTEDQA